MCHRPFSTEMERIKVLSDLRMYECILPIEYLKCADVAQKNIIKYVWQIIIINILIFIKMLLF